MIHEQLQELIKEMNGMYNDLGKLQIRYRTKHEGHPTHAKVMCDGKHSLSEWFELKQPNIIHFLKHIQENHCMGIEDAELRRYFLLDESTALLPISMLNPVRKREKGVMNARLRMRASFWGKGERRKPLDINPASGDDGSFDIVDGNSTYHVAKMIGMKYLPVKVKISNP